MLNKYLDLEGIPNFRLFFKENGKILEIKKDDYFFRQDELFLLAGYIDKGAFRYFTYTSGGKQQIIGYSFQDDFVTDYGSLQNQTKTVAYAQAIEDSIVYTITLKELNLYYENCGSHLRSRIAEVLFADIYSRLISFYCNTPEERYIKLIKENPGILNLVSLKEIASFIGITPETLSRIRKNITSYSHRA